MKINFFQNSIPEGNLNEQQKQVLTVIESLSRMGEQAGQRLLAYGGSPGNELTNFDSLGTPGKVIVSTAAVLMFLTLIYICIRNCCSNRQEECRPLLPS